PVAWWGKLLGPLFLRSRVSQPLPSSVPYLMIEVLPWPGPSPYTTLFRSLDSLAGPALSLAAASIATEPSSATVAVSGLAVGASLTSVIVIEIVFVALVLAASQLMLGVPQLSGSPRSVTL